MFSLLHLPCHSKTNTVVESLLYSFIFDALDRFVMTYDRLTGRRWLFDNWQAGDGDYLKYSYFPTLSTGIHRHSLKCIFVSMIVAVVTINPTLSCWSVCLYSCLFLSKTNMPFISLLTFFICFAVLMCSHPVSVFSIPSPTHNSKGSLWDVHRVFRASTLDYSTMQLFLLHAPDAQSFHWPKEVTRVIQYYITC